MKQSELFGPYLPPSRLDIRLRCDALRKKITAMNLVLGLVTNELREMQAMCSHQEVEGTEAPWGCPDCGLAQNGEPDLCYNVINPGATGS